MMNREAFEEHIASLYGDKDQVDLSRLDDGDYFDPCVQSDCELWQAAIASLQPPAEVREAMDLLRGDADSRSGILTAGEIPRLKEIVFKWAIETFTESDG